MIAMRHSKLSRRVLLGTAGAIGATLWLADSAEAAPAGFALEPVGPMADVFVSPTQVASFPRVLGVRVTGLDTVAKGSRVKLTFDPSMYDLLPSAVLEAGGRRTVVALPEQARNPGRGRMPLTIEVPENLDARGGCAITLGVLRPMRFPADSIRQAPTMSHTLTRPTAPATAALETGERGRVTAWGVRLGCQWDPLIWGDDFCTFVPRSVVVLAAGPGHTPTRLRARVTLDRVLAAALGRVRLIEGPSGVRVGAPQQVDGAWEFDVHGALGADERVVLALDLTVRTPKGALPGMQNPRVEVWAPAPDRSQRTTGSDTATRTDSVYDDASRREYRVVV